jgi:Leucine-rich repeat (LRR) protein
VPKLIKDTLNLEKRSLETINNDIFTEYIPMALKTLNLGENIIRSIALKTFENCVNLEYLDLSNNRIEVLDEGIFSGLVSLKTLNLQNNKIRSISTKTFTQLRKLEQLFLMNNQIEVIDNSLFNSLDSLKELKGAPILMSLISI